MNKYKSILGVISQFILTACFDDKVSGNSNDPDGKYEIQMSTM